MIGVSGLATVVLTEIGVLTTVVVMEPWLGTKLQIVSVTVSVRFLMFGGAGTGSCDRGTCTGHSRAFRRLHVGNRGNRGTFVGHKVGDSEPRNANGGEWHA